MREPTEKAQEVEASISTENVREGPDENLNRTVAARRKAAKRTLPWDLAAGELNLLPSSSLQVEVIPARKKPRLEEPLPTTTDEAASTKAASLYVSVDIPPPSADNDDVNVDAASDTQPNAAATRATGSWTSDEDATLTSAVANTSKKKGGNWDAVAALVSDRTKSQCQIRWHYVLGANIDWANIITGTWTAVEDSKLKDAVETHGGKNWDAIAALVPGRVNSQCFNRWHDVLDPSINPTTGRTGKWSLDEDLKLKDVVQTHGSKKWGAIAALIPGRTKSQCQIRWHRVTYG
jgi:hypothetical protein